MGTPNLQRLFSQPAHVTHPGGNGKAEKQEPPPGWTPQCESAVESEVLAVMKSARTPANFSCVRQGSDGHPGAKNTNRYRVSLCQDVARVDTTTSARKGGKVHQDQPSTKDPQGKPCFSPAAQTYPCLSLAHQLLCHSAGKRTTGWRVKPRQRLSFSSRTALVTVSL